jgi:hypothetical protein
VRALVGSLVLTGCAAWGGFWALRSAGLLPKDSAELAGMRGGARSLLWPGAAEQEQERGQGQQGQQGQGQQQQGQQQGQRQGRHE